MWVTASDLKDTERENQGVSDAHNLLEQVSQIEMAHVVPQLSSEGSVLSRPPQPLCVNLICGAKEHRLEVNSI